MSMTREDYVILGFDLSPYREQIYTDEWRTDENIDKWECCQTKGNIQLFTDHMNGSHLYFGYILSAQDEYDNPETMKISLTDESMSRTEEIFDKVMDALMESKLISQLESKLISQSIQEVIAEHNVPFEVICFTEYS